MCAKCLKQTDHHSERNTLLAYYFSKKTNVNNQKPVNKLKHQNFLGELKSQPHI